MTEKRKFWFWRKAMYGITCSECGAEAEFPFKQMEKDRYIAENVTVRKEGINIFSHTTSLRQSI